MSININIDIHSNRALEITMDYRRLQTNIYLTELSKLSTQNTRLAVDFR